MKSIFQIFVVFLCSLHMFSQETELYSSTICWDTSASMIERDLEKDFSILEKVFERNKNQEVQLLLFNIQSKEKNYSITNGDWSQLKKDLQEVIYDGANIYTSLKGKIKKDNVYVFTDGQKTLSKDVLLLPEKSFLVNSSPKCDAEFLQRTALLNKSRLVDFAAMSPDNIQKLNKKNHGSIGNSAQMLQGTVYVDNKPSSHAVVRVKGISDSFFTDAAGNFSIQAKIGDTLVVTSRNDKTLKIIPIKALTHTKVFLNANIVSLDEVVVVEKKLEEEMMITGYGMQDRKKVGYTVSEIGTEDISAIQTNVSETINTKVPGLRMGEPSGYLKKSGIERAEIRGRQTFLSNPYALVVLNGIPLERSSTNLEKEIITYRLADYSFIDPSNIAKITVLKGLAATNAYGSEGGNGVILITTKTAVGGIEAKKKKDLALVQNNIYDEYEANFSKKKEGSFMGLAKGTSKEVAYKKYLSEKVLNDGNPSFVVSAFDYFKDKDTEIAKGIISNLLEDSDNSIFNLRTVATALSAIGDYENAVRVNEEIISLEPNDVNAYFNKAIANKELGKYQEALNELVALSNGQKHVSVNTSGISKTIDREIKNLIFTQKQGLNTSNIDAKYLKNLKFKVRLVFEWNQPGAEFELQFVNPQKRFFNWEHSNAKIKSRIEDEIANSYRIEEYEFYGDVTGIWVINAKYLGEDKKYTETPLVLKCTIFKDFGYISQTKEEVLVHFSKFDEKKNIKTLMVADNLVSN